MVSNNIFTLISALLLLLYLIDIEPQFPNYFMEQSFKKKIVII